MTGYKQYQGNQVEGAGPLGLVLLTYDALNKSLGRVRQAIESGDVALEGEQTGRAVEALIELSTSLNMEAGGEVAESLARLYSYMIDRLLKKMCSGSTEAVDEVTALARTLREGWQGVAEQQKKKSSQMARPQVAAKPQQAAMAYGL